MQVEARNLTIIIGGGIIGLSTAYYLSLFQQDGGDVVIVDGANELLLGASGKANGMLGDYGFPSGAAELGSLSWRLHKELSEQHSGEERWEYQPTTVHYLEQLQSKQAPRLLGIKRKVSLPSWFKNTQRVEDKVETRSSARM